MIENTIIKANNTGRKAAVFYLEFPSLHLVELAAHVGFHAINIDGEHGYFSTKAIDEKKLKVAGQPKIDLKQFGEGKDLSYELQIDCLPNVTLKNFDKFKATNFTIKIEDKIIDEKLKQIANQNKQFESKTENEKAINGDQRA